MLKYKKQPLVVPLARIRLFVLTSWAHGPKLYLKTWWVTSYSPRLGLSLLCHHGGPGARPTPLGLGANPCRRACHTCFSKIRALRGRAKCWPHSIKSFLARQTFVRLFSYFFHNTCWVSWIFFKNKIGRHFEKQILTKSRGKFPLQNVPSNTLLPKQLQRSLYYFQKCWNVPKKNSNTKFVQGNIEASRWFYLLKLKIKN